MLLSRWKKPSILTGIHPGYSQIKLGLALGLLSWLDCALMQDSLSIRAMQGCSRRVLPPLAHLKLSPRIMSSNHAQTTGSIMLLRRPQLERGSFGIEDTLKLKGSNSSNALRSSRLGAGWTAFVRLRAYLNVLFAYGCSAAVSALVSGFGPVAFG